MSTFGDSDPSYTGTWSIVPALFLFINFKSDPQILVFSLSRKVSPVVTVFGSIE